MKIVTEGMLCEHGECGRPAVGVVYSRVRGEVIACCDDCDSIVVDEDCPEYHHTCENCGCSLPIN